MPEFDTADGDRVAIETPDGETIDEGLRLSFREMNPDRATGRIESAGADRLDFDSLAGGAFEVRVSAADEGASYRFDGCEIDEVLDGAATWEAESVITEAGGDAEGDVERNA